MEFPDAMMLYLVLANAGLAIFIMAKSHFKKFRSLIGMTIMFLTLSLRYTIPQTARILDGAGPYINAVFYLTIAAHLLAMIMRGGHDA